MMINIYIVCIYLKLWYIWGKCKSKRTLTNNITVKTLRRHNSLRSVFYTSQWQRTDPQVSCKKCYITGTCLISPNEAWHSYLRGLLLRWFWKCQLKQVNGRCCWHLCWRKSGHWSTRNSFKYLKNEICGRLERTGFVEAKIQGKFIIFGALVRTKWVLHNDG